ncbi:hypothetical protein [Streptomyces sp. NPDC055992]|uniref:hypothetical protein n=1 Tax=Streptomyces sp. NPDC055992 TaxID=3345673 RepID=UPI0035E03D7D
MGDWFQTVVDLDATDEEAPALGDRVLARLVAEGIVEAARTDCVLGGGGYGYPPGPHYAKAVEDPAPVDLWTNGLAVATGRTVFDSGQGEVAAAVCPLCEGEIRLVDETWQPIDDAWDPFAGTFDDWTEGGEGRVTCPACTRASSIERWTWEDDYFACGRLGFTFWNWAELTPAFVRDLGHQLGGHRTVLLQGKL